MHDRIPARIKRKRRLEPHRKCPAHRAWVRQHYCCVPGCQNQPIECAHVRTAADGGTGLKSSDKYTISLCRPHHAEQHQIGESAFEKQYGIDLMQLAKMFAQKSPHRKKIEVDHDT